MEKDLSASAELRQLYMYLFASEVRWGTSELTLFQKATKKKKKKKKQSGQEICHQMLTLLLDQDTIYILKYQLLHEVLHEYREWSKNQCN